jgi:hypothetical protein
MRDNVALIFLLYSITHIHPDPALSKAPSTTLFKKYPTIFLPAVSNGDRVGKLRVVVEGTFMCMRGFFCLATPPDASVAAR